MTFAFEKLIVYQKAVNLADQVCLRTEAFPRGYGLLVDPLNRAVRHRVLGRGVCVGAGKAARYCRATSLIWGEMSGEAISIS